MVCRGVFTFLAVLLIAGSASAVDPADKCQADKLKEAGKYGFCRLKAESKAVKKGEAPDYGKCDLKYGEKWPSIESKAGGACPTSGDEAAISGEVTDQTDLLTLLLSGGTPPIPVTFPVTGQTTCWDENGGVLACAETGLDGDVRAGAAFSYSDNGDGTITDNNTGLMWEKLSSDGSIHDYIDTYPWIMAGWFKVWTLNNDEFAGYTDWRIPNVKELQSIVDYERSSPSVDPVFDTGCTPGCTVTTCSCTWAGYYWSSTSYALNPVEAWIVNFSTGWNSVLDKDDNNLVRAVRGGL
jgi:hypothetical protein